MPIKLRYSSKFFMSEKNGGFFRHCLLCLGQKQKRRDEPVFDLLSIFYLYISFFAERSVFKSNEVRVIGPTPPGTGVMAAHFGAT